MLLLLFIKLYTNLNPALKAVEGSGKTLNLTSTIQPGAVKKILSEGNYFSDQKDIDLVADSLVARLSVIGSIDNLGSINKQNFFIATPVAWAPILEV